MSHQLEPANACARTRGRARADARRALIEAAEVIAEMAKRARRNGPEPVYASEKLGYALYKAAEGLALCGVELEDVISEAHRGYRHGRCVADGEER